MKISTKISIEHQTLVSIEEANQEGLTVLVPGASSCCAGCSSTSCAAIQSIPSVRALES